MEGSFANDPFVPTEPPSNATSSMRSSNDADGNALPKCKRIAKKQKRPLRKLDGGVLKQRILDLDKKIQLLIRKTTDMKDKLEQHQAEATCRRTQT